MRNFFRTFIFDKIRGIDSGSVAPLSAIVYPHIKVKPGAGASMSEHVYAQDFVFNPFSATCVQKDQSCSLHPLIECTGLFHSTLFFRPFRTGDVAAFVHRGKNFQYVYELPELNERANYRQVSSLDQYRFLKSTLVAAATGAVTRSGSGMPGWGVGLLVILGALCSMLLFSSPVQKASATASAHVGAPISAPALSSGDQLTSDEKLVLAKVVKESGIVMGDGHGETSFVIFSDPNCPACKEFEAKLDVLMKTDKSLSPVIVPVSFKPNSKEAVAGILCAANPSAVEYAWRAAIGEGKTAPSCEKGLNQADLNNAAFVALRFDHTPTIVTSRGKIAVGAKDFDGLIGWIKSNS